MNLPFLLCFILYLRAIFHIQAPGGLIFGGAILRRVFCFTGLGAYIWRGLFSEFYGIFGGAYVRMEICISNSIRLACSGKEIYHFCFILLCIRGQIPSTSLLGGLYSEGRFNEGFFVLLFWGAYIWRSLYMEGLIFGILR